MCAHNPKHILNSMSDLEHMLYADNLLPLETPEQLHNLCAESYWEEMNMLWEIAPSLTSKKFYIRQSHINWRYHIKESYIAMSYNQVMWEHWASGPCCPI
jgi:hypothetical protein